LVEDVPEIDTAAGSDDFDATPQPNPIPEKADVRTEGPEQTAPPAIEVPDKVPDGGGASNEAVGDAAETAAETAADTPSRDDLNSLAVTVVEPATEENRPPVTSTYDGPTPLFGAVVISRRSNLRSEPGPDSPVIAKLNPGERVFRLDDKPVFGYYRVSSGGVVGWVWWLNVRDGPGGNIQG
jgi:hypothetical protein